MSSPQVDPDRFSLVSSLYGPGSIGCWLCTLASVVVSWTLNLKSRRSDSVTNDFAAALAIPAVAAGHLFYQLYSPQYRALILNENASLGHSVVLTSTIPTVTRYAVGVEAALSVCETFSNAALALFVIAALAGHVKRATCVLVVGLLAFSTEVAIFSQTFGVDVSRSNLSRPFLFNFVEAMILILAFLGVSFVGILVVWFVGMDFGVRWTAPQDTAGTQAEVGRMVHTMSDEEIQSESARIRDRELCCLSFWVFAEMGLSGIFTSSAFCLPFGLTGWVLSGMGVFGDTGFMAAESWTSKLSFFMPGSSAAITDLDQAVALGVGLVTLGFSIWDALISRWRVTGDEIEIKRRATELRLQKRVRKTELQSLLVELNGVLEQVKRGSNSDEERRRLVATGLRLQREIKVILDSNSGSRLAQTGLLRPVRPRSGGE